MTLPVARRATCAPLPPVWEELAATPRGLRHVLQAVTAAFGGAMALAATVPIDSAVIGVGRIATQTQVKHIAHPAGGVIGAILVHSGDHVRAGQILLRLDDRVIGADARLTEETVTQLLAQKARATAEQLGRSVIAFPAELANDPNAAQAKADANRLLTLHRAETAAAQAQNSDRISQDNAAIRGFTTQIAALRQQRSLIEEERQGVHDLWQKRLVTISRMNQIERAVVEVDGSIGALEAQIAQTRAKIAETQMQGIALAQSRQVAAGNDLSQINAMLNQQQIRRLTAGDLHDRSVVRAPCDGTVEKMAVTAAGDILRAAEPIMEIVPDHDAMVVEAMISPADITRVHQGDEARVRLPGLNRATTPEWPGRVITIATDRSDSPDQKQAWYLVRISLDRGARGFDQTDLKSGMPAEVHIANGRRSLLSYLIKPLRDQFARAFRDG